MIEFFEYKKENYDNLFEMMIGFYTSDAVDHPIEERIIRKLLDDIISNEYSVKGVEIYSDKELVGFGILTSYYTSEVAGINIQLEDLYIAPEYRSKGIAKKYFAYVMEKYPNAARFRLEVSPSNNRAIKLYSELGFEILDYNQMILDK